MEKNRTSDRPKRITLLYYYALTAPEISQHYFRFPRRCKCAIVITLCIHAHTHFIRGRPLISARPRLYAHTVWWKILQLGHTSFAACACSLCTRHTIVEDTLKCERVKKKNKLQQNNYRILTHTPPQCASAFATAAETCNTFNALNIHVTWPIWVIIPGGSVMTEITIYSLLFIYILLFFLK